jgi:ATP-dependent DNA ligase
VTAGWNSRLTGCAFDGELMADGTFWIFDLVQFEGIDIRRESLHERKARLRSLADWFPDQARLVPSFANVRELGEFDEGFVWKKLSSRYGGNWFKCKRTVTVDVEVVALREYGVAETKENGKVRCVPEWVKPGQTIECVAFGVWPSGCLKTGKFLRVRDDK